MTDALLALCLVLLIADCVYTRKYLRLMERCARELAANARAIEANREATLREIERLKREYSQ